MLLLYLSRYFRTQTLFLYPNYKIECIPRNYMALNVYVALCYYKLDYYDVSQEVLGVYLAHHPTSTVAGNLKACNLFRFGVHPKYVVS